MRAYMVRAHVVRWFLYIDLYIHTSRYKYIFWWLFILSVLFMWHDVVYLNILPHLQMHLDMRCIFFLFFFCRITDGMDLIGFRKRSQKPNGYFFIYSFFLISTLSFIIAKKNQIGTYNILYYTSKTQISILCIINIG